MENQVLEKAKVHLLSKAEHKEVTVEHYSDYIVKVRYRAPFDVDIPLIEKVNADINAMVKSKAYAVIVFAEPGVNFTPEGRAFGAEKGHVGNKIAWAAVTENLAQILVVNFFIKFNKPKIPFKLFKTEKEALRWLGTFL